MKLKTQLQCVAAKNKEFVYSYAGQFNFIQKHREITKNYFFKILVTFKLKSFNTCVRYGAGQTQYSI